MPDAVCPETGCPANEILLPEITTLPPPDIEIPYDDVLVTVKPETVMLLRLDKAKARVPPLIVTPGLAVNLIGLEAVPEFAGLTDVPVYVPARTTTVSPA